MSLYSLDGRVEDLENHYERQRDTSVETLIGEIKSLKEQVVRLESNEAGLKRQVELLHMSNVEMQSQMKKYLGN